MSDLVEFESDKPVEIGIDGPLGCGKTELTTLVKARMIGINTSPDRFSSQVRFQIVPESLDLITDFPGYTNAITELMDSYAKNPDNLSHLPINPIFASTQREFLMNRARDYLMVRGVEPALIDTFFRSPEIHTEEITDYLKKHPPVMNLISDRTIFGDHNFFEFFRAHGQVSDEDYQRYNKLYNILAEIFPFTLMIYLKTKPEILQQRVFHRYEERAFKGVQAANDTDRKPELALPLNYYAELGNFYDKGWLEYIHSPGLLIETNELNIVDNEAAKTLTLYSIVFALENKIKYLNISNQKII